MAFHTRSYKSEVSCLIIWTHDVPFQKITSSVAECHTAPGLLIIPNHLAPRRTSSQSPEQFHFIQRIQRQSTSFIFRLYIKAKSVGSSAGGLFELKQYIIFLSNTSYLLPLSSRESCLVRHAVGHHDLWSTQLVLADQHPD